MNLILTSFATCAPLLLLIALGVLIKKLGFISSTTITEMSKITLKFLLPISIFMGIYNGSLESDLDTNYLIVLLGGQILVIAINTIIVLCTKMTNEEKSAIMQQAIRPNISILALPLSIEIAGEAIRSLASISVGLLTPITNGFVICEFEVFEPGPADKIKTLKRILLAPIILGSFFGLIFKFAGITLPIVAVKTLNYISNCVTPLSLIMIGASLNVDIKLDKVGKIAYAVIYKTIINPLIGLILCLLFKLNAAQIVVVMTFFASPIATSSFPTAKGYSTDIELVNQSLVISYIVAIFTLPLMITILKYFALI